jgi:hypothetical protein
MEEFIFFAVIIFFSIIESIARSRKQKKAGELPEAGLPEMPRPGEWKSQLPDFELPTYDSDPRYDADPSYDDGAVQQPARSGATRPARPSAEEMLPGALLEELARLSGRPQERKARTVKLPTESPPLPVPVPTHTPEPRVPRSRAPRKVLDRASHGPHRVHLAHAGYGTDPSTRAKSLQDDLDPLAERLSENARAVRAQLRSKDPSSLRQAFILGQVLDAPLGLRD